MISMNQSNSCRKVVVPYLLFDITKDDSGRLKCMFKNDNCTCTYFFIGKVPTDEEIIKTALKQYKNNLIRQRDSPMKWGHRKIDTQIIISITKRLLDRFDKPEIENSV